MFIEDSARMASAIPLLPEPLALVRNTSEANNIINGGLSLGRGDEVLLWDQNHPTNNVAWDVPASRFEGARKLEPFGQRDDAALAALGVTAGIHDTIGPGRIEKRTEALSQRLKQRMQDIGLDLVTPMDPALSFGVCIARVPAGQAGEISRRLYAEFGIAGAATGGMRLRPAIYNTVEHVDRAIEGLRQLVKC